MSGALDHLWLYLVAAGLAALGLYVAIVPPAEHRAQADPDHPFAGYGRAADARFPAWRILLGVVLLFGALLAAASVRASEPHSGSALRAGAAFVAPLALLVLGISFVRGGAAVPEGDPRAARRRVRPATRRRVGFVYLAVGAALAVLLALI
jgi:hypothetical protein